MYCLSFDHYGNAYSQLKLQIMKSNRSLGTYYFLVLTKISFSWAAMEKVQR